MTQNAKVLSCRCLFTLLQTGLNYSLNRRFFCWWCSYCTDKSCTRTYIWN